MWGIIIVLVLILAVAFYVISLYNGLVVARKRAEVSWNDIDVQLKKRYDLLPDLVETAKKATQLDESIFTKVTELRSRAMSTSVADPHTKAVLETQLSAAVHGLQVAVEAYPDIKSHTELLNLMNLNRDIEDKIAYSRQFYNQNVLDYNTRIEVFPAVLLASILGFKSMEAFGASSEEKQDVKVSF